MSTSVYMSEAQPTDRLHSVFLSFLPRVELHAMIYFRHLKCPSAKEEAVAEAVAIAWKWFVRLEERGKDATQFVSVLATHAARAVRSGRRLCGQERAKDALSPRAQARKGFTVASLPEGSSLDGNVFDEALHDNTQTPGPDQVIFRNDFPAWRRTRTDRHRRIIDDLMTGERTLDVADKYKISPARISQLRRDFHDDWQRFCGGAAPQGAATR